MGMYTVLGILFLLLIYREIDGDRVMSDLHNATTLLEE